MIRWKSIPGYKKIYQISNYGECRSIDRTVVLSTGVVQQLKGREIKHRGHPAGYRMVTLSKKNIPRSFLVHQLVLISFVGPCPEGMECCHENGNKADNRLSNLRWDTKSNNNKDRIRHGVVRKLTVEQVHEIRRVCANDKLDQKKLGKKYEITGVMVGKIINGKAWKFVGGN